MNISKSSNKAKEQEEEKKKLSIHVKVKVNLILKKVQDLQLAVPFAKFSMHLGHGVMDNVALPDGL